MPSLKARAALTSGVDSRIILSGTHFIPAPSATIFIDRPQLKKVSRALGSIFHGQKARVVQAVTDNWQEWLSVKALAEATEVSPATASQTLAEMERRYWVDVQGQSG